MEIEDNKDKFVFHVESRLLGRTIKGLHVTREYVALHFDDGTSVEFHVDGQDLCIRVQKLGSPTWDAVPARVM